MADRINLNRFKNVNLLANKNVKIGVAATTLLLSTIACNLNGVSAFLDKNICWVGPLSCYGGVYVLLGIASLFGRGGGGGSSGHAPSNY